MLEDLRRLAGDDACSASDADRAAHARDWWPLGMLRQRRGDAAPLPAVVVRPADADACAAVLAFASGQAIPVVPFGGGSGVCGAANAVDGCIALDTGRMDGIVIEERARRVVAGAGVLGSRLESALAERGFTLGHFPQSIDISTVGGWIATRSAGQKSGRYGRIDDIVLGMTVALPSGEVVCFPPHAGTSAGPDLMRLFLGSEGTLGVVCDATFAIRPAPAAVEHAAYRFPSFEAGLDALEAVAARDLRPAVLRLYDETDATIAFREDAPGGSVLVTRLEGDEPAFEAERAAVDDALRAAGAEPLGPALAERWWEHRNAAVGTLRAIMLDGLLGEHALVDTMEIAASWPVHDAYEEVRAALATHADVVGCHASHVYPHGACLYFTMAFTSAASDDDAERRYHAAWEAGMNAALARSATITHHHGVGVLRAPWIERELGAGLELWRTVKRALDPAGIMNPGKAGL